MHFYICLQMKKILLVQQICKISFGTLSNYSILNCSLYSPFKYRSSNFLKAKVVAINLLVFILCVRFVHDFFLCIDLHIVIVLNSDREKLLKSFLSPLKSKQERQLSLLVKQELKRVQPRNTKNEAKN